ncbi:hypothetical protein AAGG49_22680, partial [Stenotrophomonas maltophilia]|uniref:hypothetical protein n=1 Tax=Stenotrophomonas maltophilia TaxID=40324 RepID=UPI00313ED8AE
FYIIFLFSFILFGVSYFLFSSVRVWWLSAWWVSGVVGAGGVAARGTPLPGGGFLFWGVG